MCSDEALDRSEAEDVASDEEERQCAGLKALGAS
jgi:hypothetical protein